MQLVQIHLLTIFSSANGGNNTSLWGGDDDNHSASDMPSTVPDVQRGLTNWYTRDDYQ